VANIPRHVGSLANILLNRSTERANSLPLDPARFVPVLSGANARVLGGILSSVYERSCAKCEVFDWVFELGQLDFATGAVDNRCVGHLQTH